MFIPFEQLSYDRCRVITQPLIMQAQSSGLHCYVLMEDIKEPQHLLSRLIDLQVLALGLVQFQHYCLRYSLYFWYLGHSAYPSIALCIGLQASLCSILRGCPY